MSDIKSRRGVTRGIKIHNTSDRVQTVTYNSFAYEFQPGETKEIDGQLDVVRDAFGRPTEEAMANRTVAPNQNATAEMIAQHIVSIGRSRGLCLIMGDANDKDDMVDARKAWIKADTVANKAIEAKWRQRCLDSKAAGAGIPAMPKKVEDAQDFLIKYKNANVEAHKRFVVTVDGRSFNTKLEAKKHIAARYPSEASEWESLVNDTVGETGEEESDAQKGLAALEALALQSAAKKAKEKE